MAVTPGRQAEQRQRAEKGAEFGDGSPLQKHQSSGRRAQPLGSSGHRSSFQDRPLEFRQPTNGPTGRRKPRKIVPQRNNFPAKLGNRISAFKRLIVTQQGIASFKSLAVI